MERRRSDFAVLPCGIRVSVESFSLPRPLEVVFDLERSPIYFGYQVSGTIESEQRKDGTRRQIVFSPGSNAMGYYPQSSSRLRYSGGEQHCAVMLQIPPEVLALYMDSEPRGIPCELVRAMEGRRDTFIARPGNETPAKRRLLCRILDALPAVGAGTLFLESACLELMGLQMQECAAGGGPGEIALTRDDRERIHAARDILVQDLDNPPSIVELARRVGINDFKLKKGFRAVFGTTVYGYLRDYRLEKAREYLADGEMNVTEAACCVGYRNFGHFSKAFCDRFGMRPRDYRTRHRTRQA